MQQPSFSAVLAAAAALAAATVALLSWMSLAQMLLLSGGAMAAAMEIRRRKAAKEEEEEEEEQDDKEEEEEKGKMARRKSSKKSEFRRRKLSLSSESSSEEEKEDEKKVNGHVVGVGVAEDDDVFKDVEELTSSSSKSKLNLVGGVRKRSALRASGEELVRKLQELERISREGQSKFPNKRLALLEESLSSFHSIDEAEEEDDDEVFKDVADADGDGDGSSSRGPLKKSKKVRRHSSKESVNSTGSEIMIYDTTHRRVALLLHESEASSAMIADITRQLLEKRGFRVRMVKVEAEDNDDGGGAGGMVKQACSLVKENSRVRRSDCLLIAFLPTLKFSLSFDELSRQSSISRSSSTSSYNETTQHEVESDLFSVVSSARSSRGRPTVIFDFRQDEPLSANTSTVLPEHCFLAVGHARRTTQAVWKNVADRLQAAFLDMQDPESLRGDRKKQRRTLSTLKYPVVICEKPCYRHKPECPY